MCIEKIIHIKKLNAPESIISTSISNPDPISTTICQPDFKQILIVPRDSTNDKPVMKTLYPIRPYHQRYADYIEKRNRIFLIDTISAKRPKRSTIRMRKYYRMRKIASKYIISSIINNTKDKRYYAKVFFF